ncbi:MAG: hypothetical protein N2Z82_04120 [Thermomicrobium sp.]|nr:hypothetical protein [Thermomicrobium sp.]
MRVLLRSALLVAWLAGVLASWRLAFWLIVERDVGAIADFWTLERLLAYVLFIAAPAITLLPPARLARVPFLEVEAIAGWSTTLYVGTFVDPNRVSSAVAMLVILLPLLVAVSSLYTTIAALIDRRLAARHQRPPDPLTARRRGYVFGLFTVGCLLLQSLEALTLLNAGLLALIALFVELLALTWFAPVRVDEGGGGGSTRDRRRWNEYGRGASGSR